jgi:hypothetical protein
MVGDEIVADEIVGDVNILLVRVSAVALPTKVSVAAGRVSVVAPATAVACTVVVPDVEPEKPRLATGDTDPSNSVKSSEVRTCLTVAPEEWAIPDTAGLPVQLFLG